MNLFRIMDIKGLIDVLFFICKQGQIIERGNLIDVYQNLKLEAFYFTKGPT